MRRPPPWPPAQGRGWSFIELFYRNQGAENSGYATGAFLRRIAEAAGVPDLPRWEQERASTTLRQQVEATTREAGHLGFSGAPSFAVEGPGVEGLELLGTPSSTGQLIAAITKAAG